VSQRRLVRIADQFFERLDMLFPSERSGDGLPSATDFLLHEMPPIIEKLATEFDTTTIPISDESDVRVLLGAGMLVRHIAVYVELVADGSIEAFYLDIN
jgi:Flp pilus assembly protein TadB